MDVDGAPPRYLEHRLRQDLPEGDDDGHVGAKLGEAPRPLRVPQPRGLYHGKPGGERANLDRRRRQTPAAMRGTVGLGDDRDDLVQVEERLQGRERELGRSVEEDSKARRRGGRRPRGGLPS